MSIQTKQSRLANLPGARAEILVSACSLGMPHAWPARKRRRDFDAVQNRRLLRSRNLKRGSCKRSCPLCFWKPTLAVHKSMSA